LGKMWGKSNSVIFAGGEVVLGRGSPPSFSINFLLAAGGNFYGVY